MERTTLNTMIESMRISVSILLSQELSIGHGSKSMHSQSNKFSLCSGDPACIFQRPVGTQRH